MQFSDVVLKISFQAVKIICFLVLRQRGNVVNVRETVLLRKFLRLQRSVGQAVAACEAGGLGRFSYWSHRHNSVGIFACAAALLECRVA